MKGEAEEPPGHLLTFTPSVFFLGNLSENTCNHDVFATRQFVVLPPHPLPGNLPSILIRVGSRVQFGMDCAQNWEVFKTGARWDSPNVSLADDLVDPGRGYEVGKHVEAIHDRPCCKLVRPLGDCRFVVVDFDTIKENIETIYCEGGIEVCGCDRREVVQGQQTGGSIQRYPERPRDTVLIQHRHLSV